MSRSTKKGPFADAKLIAKVMKGKPRRARGNRIKHRPDWKKAVVSLAPGDKIELFEGV